MATLIPNIAITDFKKLKSHQLKRLNSCEITSDGEYLFTFINSNTDYVKTQAEYLAMRSNTVGGETIEEVSESNLAPV